MALNYRRHMTRHGGRHVEYFYRRHMEHSYWLHAADYWHAHSYWLHVADYWHTKWWNVVTQWWNVATRAWLTYHANCAWVEYDMTMHGGRHVAYFLSETHGTFLLVTHGRLLTCTFLLVTHGRLLTYQVMKCSDTMMTCSDTWMVDLSC